MYGSPALKVRGKMFVCRAINRSAQPDSLVACVGFDERDRLIAEEPTVYYLTDHYVNGPVVLARLCRVDRRRATGGCCRPPGALCQPVASQRLAGESASVHDDSRRPNDVQGACSKMATDDQGGSRRGHGITRTASLESGTPWETRYPPRQADYVQKPVECDHSGTSSAGRVTFMRGDVRTLLLGLAMVLGVAPAHAQDVSERFPNTSDSGRAAVEYEDDTVQVVAAWGDLYFASPTGAWEAGTYSLVVEGDGKVLAMLPIELD